MISEKDTVKTTLETLIEQTYIVEEEYKNLNRSYKDLQNFIKQIVESLPNAIWVLDKENKIFLENSEAIKIKGALKIIDTTKETSELEYKNNHYLVKIKDIKKYKIISTTDITLQKKNERLVSMGKIAAHLSHEIRNPIGSVSLLASTLLKKVSPLHKPLVIEIKKSIYRVERIIKATLLFTKGLHINREFFNLTELQEEIEQLFENYSISKDIELSINFPKNSIYADFDLIAITMQNFLYNAIDAIEEDNKDNGTITFDYKEDSKYHIIIVKDSGKEIVDKNILYEPFRTTKTKGQGLGLSLSLQIVNAHNGKIELLENEKGFQIYLEK